MQSLLCIDANLGQTNIVQQFLKLAPSSLGLVQFHPGCAIARCISQLDQTSMKRSHPDFHDEMVVASSGDDLGESALH